MNEAKQVNKSHYAFERYMTKARWASVWHQIDEVSQLKPENVLEIGPGLGVFKKVASAFDIAVETLDLDPELNPDHLGSATALPFEDSAYDVVCAFQMLEHLPYEKSLQAFKEMARVSKRHIVISLPDAKTMWPYRVHIPKFGGHDILIPKPIFRLRNHHFDGEHYWEINKIGFELRQIVNDFSKHAQLIKTYRVPENPYHRFFIFFHQG